MKKVFFIRSIENDNSEALLRLVQEIAETLNVSVSDTLDIPPISKFDEMLESQISSSDLIIADLTLLSQNVVYEYGLSRGKNKPLIILMSTVLDMEPGIPYESLVLTYGSTEQLHQFKGVLAKHVEHAINDPNEFLLENFKKVTNKRDKLFISYCHKDKGYLERLLIHLKPLEKSGSLDIWVDTKIKPGEKWKKEIEGALSKATSALLLISADFLASEFIAENELPPLLKKAEETGTRILPLILKPCRFSRDPHLKHFQAFNDPKKPLVLLNDGEQEKIYDEIAEEIERWSRQG